MIGHAVTSMTYKAESVEDSQGQYELTVAPVGHFQFSYDEEDNDYLLKSKYKAEITGTSDKSKTTAFKLEFEFTIFFELPKDTYDAIKDDDEYLNSNEWFFANFANNLVREIGENVFSHTSYKGLRIPSSRD